MLSPWLISVYLVSGVGSFNGLTTIPSSCCVSTVFVADFTGDGIPELFAPRFNLAVYPGIGNGTFGTNIPGTPRMDLVAVEDFDGTGRFGVASLINSPGQPTTLNIFLNKPLAPQVTLLTSAATASLGTCIILTAASFGARIWHPVRLGRFSRWNKSDR